MLIGIKCSLLFLKTQTTLFTITQHGIGTKETCMKKIFQMNDILLKFLDCITLFIKKNK